MALLLAAVSSDAVEVVPSATPQQVFAGGARAVEVRFRNDAAGPVRVEVRLHLFQLTSATAAPMGGARAWKTLTVQPGQTVVESASLDIPAVRAATRFAARWLDAGGRLLGVTEFWAHPENVLDALKPLAGGLPIGVVEDKPGLQLVLAARGIPIAELKHAEDWSQFRGRLALVVNQPESTQGELRLDPALLARAKEGLTVVWLRTAKTILPPAPPLVERVRVGRGTVLLAPASTLGGLERSPAAQLALVRLAELALSTPTQILAPEP
ncbi:MAG: hypothetical protein ABMA26_25890 [Limisphaerales bacterium]